MDQPLIAGVIQLTLNYGVYATRQAKDVSDALAALEQWRPHVAVVDMDIGGDRLVRRLVRGDRQRGTAIPVPAPTRRGDLRTN